MKLPRSASRFICVCLLACPFALDADSLPGPIPNFIDQHCADCHDDIEKKGDLDLWTLAEQPVTPDTLQSWIKAHDRAQSGEMPPKKKKRPKKGHLNTFLKLVSNEIIETEEQMLADTGRSIKRRLNRYEYENSLRDLLSLPYLEIKGSLPEDPTAHGYNKVGEALDVSHVQVARYLRTAEYALREAVIPQVEKPEPIQQRYYTWQQPGFRKGAGPDIRKTFPVVGLELRPDLMTRRVRETGEWIRPDLGANSDSDRKEQEAVIMLMSTYEPAEIQFNEFRAPVSGPYRLRFSGYTVWMAPDFSNLTKGRRTEPVTIYSDTSPRILRRLGAFDFAPEPSVHELEVWLKAGETIRPDASRLVRSRPPNFKNPLLEEDGMPGVAFQWMEVEGPLFESWPPPNHKLLFGDLDVATVYDEIEDTFDPNDFYDLDDPVNEAAEALMNSVSGNNGQVVVLSRQPAQNAERLLNNFIEQAYRHPVNEADRDRFLRLILDTLDKGHSFMDAMIAGYTAVLASPGYLYHQASLGPLDGYALAERLAYFLWNSPPDEELLRLAASGEILHPYIKSQQVERLLADARSRRFADAFLDYWLDLRYLAASGPDTELYPEYQLDDALVESIPEETQLYFLELIKGNLGISHVVDSDFIIINERLATLYDIEDVRGAHFRPVELCEDSPRGGLMTQASILKVTANGTSSSPVTRGAWIMERILGDHIPPPPPTVQAIESDIRGAKTIREQLALHRSEESCNVCHVKIDPSGFALENFDVMGSWRDRYRTTGKGQGELVPGFGHDGLVNRYRIGLPVDASGKLPDGRTFNDIRELKNLLLTDEKQLARNFVEQLTIYATGAPNRFSDRQKIDAILEISSRKNYGVRSLIHELVKSDLFLYK
ncbi:MAG: DUF1592 domain-containing protein [Opitutaceae bacterium]|nr:DUF1592 domain-containing protein [Opitutaceae bacterium]